MKVPSGRLIEIGFAVVFGLIAVIVVSISLTSGHHKGGSSYPACEDGCTFRIVESIPQEMDIKIAPESLRTHIAFMELFNMAKRNIYISAFYWELLQGCSGTALLGEGQLGCDVYETLCNVSRDNGLDVYVVQTNSSEFSDDDSKLMKSEGLASVRSIDFTKLWGGGVLHTKMILIDDGEHFYVGSANMDWKSISQVKELGITIHNCPCLGSDLLKNWGVYWQLGSDEVNPHLPDSWHSDLDTHWNMDNPRQVQLNDTNGLVYFSQSPSQLCPEGRTVDINALIDVINEAEETVYVSVMDFVPLALYSDPPDYWPLIFEALKTATIERAVDVKILVSKWNHTLPFMLPLLRAFHDVNSTCTFPLRYNNDKPYCSGNVEVRVYVVPELTSGLSYSYSRVNHAKFMVTDKQSFITTSNWARDYYQNTAGVSFVSTHSNVRQQLVNVFERDFDSQYSHPLSDFVLI